MCADGYVADELATHGLTEQAVELLLVFDIGRSAVALLSEVEVPVPLRMHPPAVRAHREVMPRGQQANAREQRAVSEDVLEREVLEQVRQAQTRRERLVLEHRLDL